MTVTISLILWLALVLFENQILIALGADEVLLPLAKSYLNPVKYSLPVFLFMQFFAAFLRNDNHPTLSTMAVILGGVFNILGDYVFVFVLDMGILGAGLATCLGATLSVIVMITHFKHKKNTLKLVAPKQMVKKINKIIVLGFSTFFIDIAMGLLTMLFNVQIMKYLNSDALAVYGIIVNVATFVQCCAYGVGQASQPILSANYGAKRFDRINKLFKYNVITILIISIFWVGVTMLFPEVFVHAFMKPSKSVLYIATSIIRLYCISFILLPFNIYITYYFQSTMKANLAFIISISRGLLISGTLILFLPLVAESNSIWYAMPLSEVITFIFVMLMIKKTKKEFIFDEILETNYI